MDALSTVVGIAPTDPRVLPLIETHLALMQATSPAESVHALPAAKLAEGGVRFFAILEGDEAVAMGALKPLGDGRGEIKSMHVRQAHRGRGLADQMLRHLLAVAREGDDLVVAERIGVWRQRRQALVAQLLRLAGEADRIAQGRAGAHLRRGSRRLCPRPDLAG